MREAGFAAALSLCAALSCLPAWAADEAAGAPAAAKTEHCVPEEAPERLTTEQLACLGERYGPRIRELQEADPVADARREAGEGDFRLVRFYSLAGSWEPGITCALKPPQALTRAWLNYSNIVDLEGIRFRERAQLRYARAYNRTLVAHDGFPYADICRLRSAGEKEGPFYRSLSDLRRRPTDGRRAQNLHEAVRFHNRAAVRQFLKQGADPNRLDVWGFTPLGWAVLTGRADMIRDLVAAGADADRHGDERPTPLVLAVYSRSLKLVRQLVAAGAQINLESPTFREMVLSDAPKQGGPPLRAAVSTGELKIARFLLKRGADPNIRNWFLPPIFAAIKGRHLQMIRLLLENGADVHQRDNWGLSVIQFAAEERYGEGVRLIAEAGGLADARSESERLLWWAALKGNRTEILADLVAFGAHAHLLKNAEQQKLLDHIAGNERRAVLDQLALADTRAADLEKAISDGDLARVRSFYTGGAKLAEGRMRTGLIMAVQARQVPVIAWFLKEGADPHGRLYFGNLEWLRDKSRKKDGTRTGPTAFALAFHYGPMEAVQLIIAHTDLPDQRSRPWWQSVLGMAFSGYEKNQDLEIIDLAVKLSGDISKTGPQADQFLANICAFTGRWGTQVLETYLERGYRPRQKDDPPPHPMTYPSGDQAFGVCLEIGAKHALLLLRHGTDPKSEHIPAALRKLYTDEMALKVVDELLKRGADPNRPDGSGDVALDHATPSREEIELEVLGEVLRRGDGDDSAKETDRVLERPGEWIVYGVDPEKADLHRKELKELNERFARARRLLRKYGAKTRAELEEEGVLEPRPKPEPPVPALPVR